LKPFTRQSGVFPGVDPPTPMPPTPTSGRAKPHTCWAVRLVDPRGRGRNGLPFPSLPPGETTELADDRALVLPFSRRRSETFYLVKARGFICSYLSNLFSSFGSGLFHEVPHSFSEGEEAGWEKGRERLIRFCVVVQMGD
jgi:hypothetical protein